MGGSPLEAFDAAPRWPGPGLFGPAGSGRRARHYRRTLARAEDELEAGLHTLAWQDLTRLLDGNPGSDEILFLMGSCEKARGRADLASAAWAKISPRSPYAFRALEARVQLEIEDGRLTAAEQLIVSARANRDPTRSDPGLLLGAVFCLEGRFQEAMQLIETLWQQQEEAGSVASETAVKQLRLYIQLQIAPTPDEMIRATLDRAGRVSPNDDRIWLWKAKLAMRTKALEDAERWINLCLKQRPDDPLVWQVRLDWAIAANRVDLAQQAVEHLPASGASPAQLERRAAWIAAQRGDHLAEQTALERLIALDPTDFTATDRLITLLITDGRTDLAAERRLRKDTIASFRADTGYCSPGTSPGVMPRRWPDWPSNSAAGLRLGHSWLSLMHWPR